MAYKRILTVQDISCVGQCSMTVALPILSACGHETCILPTAVLSTHTGGFGKPAAVSLDDILESVTAHWKSVDIRFEGIYTGYLGSIRAIRCVERIVDELLAPGGIFVADPAMADHGKRYSGLDADYAKAMEQLCHRADILLPNITEAAMFAGLPYREQPDEAYIRSLLAGLDNRCVVLTGVGYTPDETGVVIREGESWHHYRHPRVEKNYHGTGDMFAAAFVGALLQEKNPRDAATIAAEFTRKAIENTYAAPAHWYGVKFETALPELIRMLQE